MLDEIELLVGGGRPEILTAVGQFVGYGFVVLGGGADRGFLAERGIGQDVIHTDTGIRRKGIPVVHRHVAVNITDIVQIQIHQAHFVGGGHQFRAEEGFVFEESPLFHVQRVLLGNEFIGGEEKSAAAAAGIRDGLHGFGAKAAHHCPNERTGRKILSRAAFDVLGVLLEQALVYLSLDVGGHRHPSFFVDHLHHAIENGGIVNLIGRALKNAAENAAQFTELFENRLVHGFQFRAFQGVHIRPCVSGRNAGFFVVGRLGILVRHF